MKQRVLVFEEKQRARLQVRELPEIREGEALVRSVCSLVSPGTEIALYEKTHIGFADPEISWCAYPLDIGYATAGSVEASCIEGLEPGSTVVHYGPHADRTVISKDTPLWEPVPEGVSPSVSCFGRFAQIAYSSVAAAVRPPRRVEVYGAGIVGNLAAQWFKDLGAETSVVDLSPRRLEIAAACGLPRARKADEPYDQEAELIDTVVEATGVASVVNEALECVAADGQVILLGSIRRPITVNAYKLIHRKAVLLSGAHESILGSRRGEVLRRSLAALKQGRLRVDPIITRRIRPDELPNVYEDIASAPDEYFGVLIEWEG